MPSSNNYSPPNGAERILNLCGRQAFLPYRMIFDIACEESSIQLKRLAPLKKEKNVVAVRTDGFLHARSILKHGVGMYIISSKMVC